MTRAHVWIGITISAPALLGVLTIPDTTAARQEKPCADRSTQAVVVRLAREINVRESTAHQTANSFQSMSAIREFLPRVE
jgi:hypothetical protein